MYHHGDEGSAIITVTTNDGGYTAECYVSVPFVDITGDIVDVPGDINGDGVFDYYDVTELYAAYQSGEVDADTMDVNNDGVVDYYDVAKLYAAYRGTATLT